MAQQVRIKLNSGGVRALLKSPGVRGDLRRRAQAVASSAGPGHEVHSSVSAQRARSEVVTATMEARIAEAHHRNLTRAIGAGR